MATSTTTTTAATTATTTKKDRIPTVLLVCSFATAPKQDPQTELYYISERDLRETLKIKGKSYWDQLHEKQKRGPAFANCVPYMFHVALVDRELVTETEGSHRAFEYLYDRGATTLTPTVNRDLLAIQRAATQDLDFGRYIISRVFQLQALDTVDVIRVPKRKGVRAAEVEAGPGLAIAHKKAKIKSSSSSEDDSESDPDDDGDGEEEDGDGDGNGPEPVEDDDGECGDEDDDDSDDIVETRAKRD